MLLSVFSALLLVLLLPSLAQGQVLLYSYNNTGFGGSPSISTIANVSSAAFSVPPQSIGSFDMRTMLALPTDGRRYILNCSLSGGDGGLGAVVWIDNHILCISGYPVWPQLQSQSLNTNAQVDTNAVAAASATSVA